MSDSSCVLPSDPELLARGLAHDLRNTAGTISGYIQLAERELERHAEDPDYERLIRYISSTSHALESLSRALDRLSLFGRWEAPAFAATTVEALLDHAITQTLDYARQRGYGDREVVRIPETGADGPITGEFAPAMTVDLLRELLTNALLATPPRQQVTVRWRVEWPRSSGMGVSAGPKAAPLGDGWVQIQIENPGELMAPQTIAQARRPFIRDPQGRYFTRLGLPLVFRLADRLNASVRLESSAEGTRAVISLPLRQHESVASPPAPAVSPPAAPMPRQVRQRPVVLVVDDDEHIRAFLNEFLHSLSWEVVTARDGVEGVALFESHRPDLVLLDLLMPRKNGLAMLTEIKAVRKEVPVIIITAYAGPEQLDRVRSAGALTLVQKPFRVGELEQLLREQVPSLFGASQRQ